MADFDKGLAFTLRWEGGFTDDPDDPGGRTNHGITQKVYREWKGDPDADVERITMQEVGAIYRSNYWNALCDGVPDPLATVLFDTAVNCGVGRTRRWLLDAPGGTGTVNAAKYVMLTRRSHYEALAVSNPRMTKYLHGWMNRVDALKEEVGL